MRAPEAHRKFRPVNGNETQDALMEALTSRVRFLASDQIARTFWPQLTLEAVRMRLQRLAERDWIESNSAVVHPELPLAAPVFVWNPGEEEPHCGELAYICQRRWNQPLHAATVWRVTPRTLRLRGGTRIPLRRDQATHDLHVGAIYCRLWLENHQDAADWRSEDHFLSLPDERLPDAVIVNADEEMRRVVEFGGTCRSARVAKLHAFGLRHEIPYELW